MNLPYAHDVDYWKTGTKRTATQWLDLAAEQIRQHGGTNLCTATGEQDGREAYMIAFQLDGNTHRIVWPVLPVRHDQDAAAARRQAATSLYHDVKARCVAGTRYGDRFGFFQYRLLPNGQAIGELADAQIAGSVPRALMLEARQP